LLTIEFASSLGSPAVNALEIYRISQCTTSSQGLGTPALPVVLSTR
jgi:hypothetical protein